MYVLGISSYYHDSAATILYNGEIIAASQEERFTRKKHDSSFPNYSIKYCLKEAGIDGNQLENIVFYEKPFLKFERLLETYLAFAPKGFKSFSVSMPLWVKDKLFQKKELISELADTLSLNKKKIKKKLLFSEHHLSHAASAFYPSPFKNAAILTMDGVGEWATTSLSVGNGKNLKVIKEINFPHSLGLLYSAFTYYTGFKVNSGEYKVMGLAPYGEPKYFDVIKNNILKVADDGSFQLDMSYFDYATGLKMTNKKFDKLFGGPPRSPESNITQREMDLAASVQKVVEDVLIKLAKDIAKRTGQQNLCLAGGVALNCVANGVLLREKIFKNIWVQPASGDAGGSLGAALSIWHLHHKKERTIHSERDLMKGSFLGPQFTNLEVENELSKLSAVYDKYEHDELIAHVAKALSDKKAVGWVQGRMEFGPRALGARSIIADPRSPKMQKLLNLKVKFRESFRPFAPSILREDLSRWFELDVDSPYMLFCAQVNKEQKLEMTKNQKLLFGIEKLNVPRSKIPAVTHIDYSARIQTVHSDTNNIYYRLIKKFKEITGCPILVNTSFNIRGEPIVCNVKDAFRCFMGTDLDYLVCGNFILEKNKQKVDRHRYTGEFEFD